MAKQIDPLKIIKNSWPQIEGVLCNASVALLERTGSKAPPYDFRGSGTLIAIKGRLFIATAAHVIPHDPNCGNLWILSKKRRRPRKDGAFEFLKFKKGKGVDVGYLELSPESASKCLDCQPCPIERIRILGPGRSQRHIVLVGAPQEFVKWRKKSKSLGVFPTVKPYITTPIPVEEWPDVPSDVTSPKVDTDIFLDFPRDGITEQKTGEPLVYETAEGYSGGGIWDLGFDPGKLWKPTDVSLFGIQSSWNSTKRYLRAIQVLHWLRLVYNDYPDLQPMLTNRFPTLNHMN